MARVNTDYFNKKIEEINNIASCEKLNAVLEDIQEEMQKQIDSLVKQIAEYDIILQALTVPSSIDDVLSWANKVISSLTILAKPYLEAIQIQIELAQKYIELFNAINTKISTLSCDIAPPTPPEVPELP